MHLDKYKTLMKETEDNTNRKIYCVLRLQKSVLLNMTILPKTIYKFSSISINIPMTFFTELIQVIKKNYGNKQKNPEIPNSYAPILALKKK